MPNTHLVYNAPCTHKRKDYAMSMKTTAPGPSRVDWETLKTRLDLGVIATNLLGPAPGRRGARGLWWPCPLHQDANPSFNVDAKRGRWRCFGCGVQGDAAELVQRLQGIDFVAAIRWLDERFGDGRPAPSRPSTPARPPVIKGPSMAPARRSALEAQEAEALVATASEALWTAAGAVALHHLRRERGLTDETIRLARLGFVAGLILPTARGKVWTVAGIVVPWFESGRLTLLKVRRLDGREPKYVECFRDEPSVLAPQGLEYGRPLVAVEGEFDALLLAQELLGLANVVTLGSASEAPSPEMLLRFMSMRPWFVALDADPAGATAAAKWPQHAIRVQPPHESKDWCETFKDGWPLRTWWEQWFTAEFDRRERAAIFEFDAGMTRLKAERRAGLSTLPGTAAPL